MQIATFAHTGTTHVGVVDPVAGSVVSLGRASGGDPRFGSVLALVRGGEQALDEARELAGSHPAHAAYDVDAVTLRAPLPDAPRVHGRPAGVVARGPGDLVRADAAIALGAVVDAAGGLFGATIVAGAQGPVLVTADELRRAPTATTTVEVRVNGAPRSRARVRDAVPALERALGDVGHRRPGDLVVLDLAVAPQEPGLPPLRAGDEIEVEVTGLGLLRNRIER